MYKYVAILILSLIAQSIWSQNKTIEKLLIYPLRANSFTEVHPHEKVFLHMDNRSYFLDETLWYKVYVVNSDSNKLTTASEILHLELLTPEGAVIRSQKHRLKEGQCDGYITLDSALYSGYFEIRAYTKSMLNFDEQNYFSRVFPLFEKPKKIGDYDSIRRTRPRRRTVGYPEVKEKEENKMSYYSIHFYPEGGHLVANLKSNIAFQIKDRSGKIVNTNCYLYDNKNILIDSCLSTHLGMGTFQMTPKITRKGYYLKIQDDFKDSKYHLPTVFEQGHTLRIDNLSDSLKLKVWIESTKLDDTLGVVVLSRGRVGSISVIAPRAEKTIHELSISKSNLREGVNQVVLYDKEGRELASRMIFIRKHNSHTLLTIKSTSKTKRRNLKPYKRQELLFEINDNKGLPVATNFSLSIFDSTTHIPTFCIDNIYTSLLLSSEIKGFIPNVDYYFESKDVVREKNLDILLMVKGWSRYKWEHLCGYHKIDIKYFWEKELTFYGREYSQLWHKFTTDLDWVPDGSGGGYIGSRVDYMPTDDIKMLLVPNTLSLLNVYNDSILFNKNKLQYMYLHKEVPFFSLQKTRSGQFSMSFNDFYGETKLLSSLDYNQSRKINQEYFFIMHSDVSPQEKQYDFFETNRIQEKISPYTVINGEYIKQYSLDDVNVYGHNNLCFHPAIKTNYYNRGFYNQLFPSFNYPILDRVSSRCFSSLREYKKNYDIEELYQIRGELWSADLHVYSPNEYLNYYKLPLGTITFIANTTVDTSNQVANQDHFTIPIKQEAPDIKDYGLDTSKYTYFIDSTIIHTSYVKRDEVHNIFKNHSNYIQYKIEDILKHPRSISPKQLPNYVVEHFCRIIKYKSLNHTRVGFNNEKSRHKYDHNSFLADGYAYDNVDIMPWHALNEINRRVVIFQGLARLEKEFYSPDYSKEPLPEQADYRRTLYWNPNVQTDSTGRARVVFYNNSTCKSYQLDAQGMTEGGIIMINK